MSEYRHEWKHEIDLSGHLAVRQRLRAVAQVDSHAAEGAYLVRSLYFDTPGDKALREKLDGVNCREKFRIRHYNDDLSSLRLEKKSRRNGLGRKDMADMTPEEVRALLRGETGWMTDSGRPLLRELCGKMRSQGLRPRAVVEYRREPFVYAPGNVRVTLDYDIRAGLEARDFLDGGVAIPAAVGLTVLEVKWDEFLPDVIRDAVQLPGCRTGSFSKYALCRRFG